MAAFFETYKTAILNTFLVVVVFVALLLLTRLLRKWLLGVLHKYPNMQTKSVRLLTRILNVLWVVLAVMAIIFLFFNEIYARFQNDFRLILYIGIVSIITIVLASLANIWFRRKVASTTLSNADPTTLKFLRYVAVSAIYTTGFMIALMAFPSLRGVAQTVLGGAGVIALIVGVASQEALANLVGGLFIISFKPFKIGDVIKMPDSMTGTVVDITLRHTVLRNRENKMIVVPNAIMNKEKIINNNLGEPKVCDYIEIGISYTCDVDLAKKIMQEECEKHPLLLDNRTATEVLEGKNKVRVALVSLDEYYVTIRAWAWARNSTDSFDMRCELLERIKKRFDNEGIEIPYPYRTLVFDDSTPSNSQNA